MCDQFKNLFTSIPGVVLRLCLLMVVISSPFFIALSYFDSLKPDLFSLHYMQGNVYNSFSSIVTEHYRNQDLLKQLNTNDDVIVISLLND